MANSVDCDKTAGFELSHLVLHCLHKYLFWFARLKGFSISVISKIEKKKRKKSSQKYLVCMSFLIVLSHALDQ